MKTRTLLIPEEVTVYNTITGDRMQTAKRNSDNEAVLVDEKPWIFSKWLDTFLFNSDEWGSTITRHRIAHQVIGAFDNNDNSHIQISEENWRAVRDFLEQEGKDDKGNPKGYSVANPHGRYFMPFVDAVLSASEMKEP